jgi:TonB family protein
MTDFLIYDLKVALLIAVFYMFYRLMLAHETFHRVNRIVLLLTAVASYVLPLCVITYHETVVMHQAPLVTIEGLQATVYEPSSTPWWKIALPVLFIIGASIALGHTLCSLFRIIRLINHSEQHPQDDGTIVCVTGNADISPFSWMHYIVMNRSDYETHDAAILAHERGHIRLCHSWDLILVDTLTALQWFNPAIWMLRSDLRAIHEYEADGAVLSQGINARQYQYLLITKAGGIGGYSLANGITHSALKNRITMMTNKTSKSSHLLKLLALLPIVGVTLALNAETVKDYVYDEPQKQVPVKKGRKASTIKAGNGTVLQVVEQEKADDRVEPAASLKIIQTDPNKKPLYIVDGVRMNEKQAKAISPNEIASISVLKDKAATDVYGQDAKDGVIVISLKKKVTGEVEVSDVFDVVEVMPQFPGGAPALMQYLSQNIRYPKEAMESETQGRVIVTFVVCKDGSICDAKVVKSVSPALDAEGLRVISSMPNWTPGTQSGKPVNVKYTVPISFRLDGKKTESTNAQKSSEGQPLNEVINRLPGAKIDENGNLTINGKPVKKIVVDGKPVTKQELPKVIEAHTVHMETDDLIISTKEK